MKGGLNPGGTMFEVSFDLAALLIGAAFAAGFVDSIAGGGKDASSPQVRLIEHADVKRMLLAQKSYGEGALAQPVLRAAGR